VYFSSLYGWGCLIKRRLGFAVWPFPLTISLGLVVWIFFGGVLNLMEIAVSPILDSLVIFGLGTAMWEWRNLAVRLRNDATFKRTLFKAHFVRYLPLIIFIAVIFTAVASTLSVPRIYNFHDDFEKYLNHPIRMLTTGTLRGSPLSSLGSETLGGQAFLHAIALSHWPTVTVNAVDAVLAFILCLLILAGVALRVGLPWRMTTASVLLAVIINPQVVNISALFTAVAVLLLLLGLWLSIREQEAELTSTQASVLVGLIYAALTALKSIYLLFAIAHFLLTGLSILIADRSLKTTLTWAAKTGCFFLVFISPWLLIYAENWNVLLSTPGQLPPVFSGGGQPPQLPLDLGLFSTQPLFYGYGTSALHYTATVLMIGIYGTYLLILGLRNLKNRPQQHLLAATGCLAPTLLYIFSLVFISPRLLGPDHGLRYMCPVVIASLPAAVIMTAAVLNDPPIVRFQGHQLAAGPSMVLLVLSLAVLAAFSGSFVNRTRQSLAFGTQLPSIQPTNAFKCLPYNKYALGSSAAAVIGRAQLAVPEGAAMAAWTPLAMHLDYRRNPIVDIDPAGLANPWVGYPFTGKPQEGVKYLIREGIHYVLWHYKSYPVRSEDQLVLWTKSPYPRSRKIGWRTHRFVLHLRKLIECSEVLYDDGSIAVMRLYDIKEN
ncbi:MAG: hypothetical protein WBN03_19825, partial [Desulfobacterales bacterium]